MLIYNPKVERDSDRPSAVFALPDRRSATFLTNPNQHAWESGGKADRPPWALAGPSRF